MISTGTTALGILINNRQVKQAEFPLVDYPQFVKGGIYKDAGWVWLYDLNTVSVLKDFIYEDIDMNNNIYLNDASNVKLNY